MNETDLLEMLKLDLGITAEVYDKRLGQYLKAAETEIAREGIALDPGDIGDCQLTVMYAAWRWRRRDSGNGMPRMLRFALNNRLMSQKAAGNTNTMKD